MYDFPFYKHCKGPARNEAVLQTDLWLYTSCYIWASYTYWLLWQQAHWVGGLHALVMFRVNITTYPFNFGTPPIHGHPPHIWCHRHDVTIPYMALLTSLTADLCALPPTWEGSDFQPDSFLNFQSSLHPGLLWWTFTCLQFVKGGHTPRRLQEHIRGRNNFPSSSVIKAKPLCTLVPVQPPAE